ncbi:C4-dicarboxylate TRAP transporter large permease protein DctM [subsurface metagenome]
MIHISSYGVKPMIELSPEIITAIMFGAVLLGVLTGYPLAIIIGAIALGVGYLVVGTSIVYLMYVRTFAMLTNYILLAIPLFIFMGTMLERSGITDKLYGVLFLCLGRFRGGLAEATVLVGTVIAACVGVVSASVSMLTVIALPSMLKRGYNKALASGSICAGGTLGILIPPSVMLVFYGPMAGISVGKLFMGAFMPGLLLSGLYCIYIAIRCSFQSDIAGLLPSEERAVPLIKKMTMLLTSILPVTVIILSVLGSIFLGVAAPTEAAGVGAFAATLLALGYGKLNWQSIKQAALTTVKISGMVFFLVIMCYPFTSVFISAGCGDVVERIVLGIPGGRWAAFALIMFIIFIEGMFIDWVGIVLIMVPILTPIIPELGFDPLWFALMICINLQMSFMTPPFSPSIFFLLGAADPKFGVRVGDVIRGVCPFVALILLALGLCILFPEIILWLPSMMIK